MIDKIKQSGFVLNEIPTQQIKDQYQNIIPDKIFQIWDELGFGSFLAGYLKVVNPNNFKDLLRESSELCNDQSLVLFTTSMGDLLVLDENSLLFLDFRHNHFEAVATRELNFFFQDIFDDEFLEDNLSWNPYLKAKEKMGIPGFDECFGYEPILAAGGSEKVENLRKVKLIEHISLITQFAGPV
jgi:hypothetical protein